MEADTVIVADGSHSALSRQLGLFVEDPQLCKYGARGYYDNVEGLENNIVNQMQVPVIFVAKYMRKWSGGPFLSQCLKCLFRKRAGSLT